MPSTSTNRTTCREMPRWATSSRRSSTQSASGTSQGSVSRPAACSAGGRKMNRTRSGPRHARGPPATYSTWPETKPAPSLTKKLTACAMSATSPARATGIWAARAAT